MSLIVEAARRGGAEAAAQFAVLSAMGMFVEQSWQAALGAICFSAERGWRAAQAQLRTLAADRELAATDPCTHRTDPALWRKLADSIDLDFWHEPSPGIHLHEAPVVRRFPRFIDAQVCAWMIGRARGRLTRAAVYDAFARKVAISETRTNSWAVFNVTDCDLVSVLVQSRMCAHTGVSLRHLEPMSILHYDVGEQIGEHFDFIDPRTPHYEEEIARNGQRVVTFLVYLNADYEGGETQMPELGLSHKGQCGEGLLFINALRNGDPDPRTLHAGRAPVRGEKWVVSQFMRSRPTF